MKVFNKILVPDDFSEYAEEALSFATLLAGNHTLVTILNILELPYVHDPSGMIYYENKAEELERNSNNALDKLMVDLKEWYPTVTFETVLLTNLDPAEAICKTQKENEHDLIVMGSHGRKGLDRLLMGSVAESVMRSSHCPVLIIKK